MVDSVTASLCFGYRSRREAIQLPHTQRERERERDTHTGTGEIGCSKRTRTEQNRAEATKRTTTRQSHTTHTTHSSVTEFDATAAVKKTEKGEG